MILLLVVVALLLAGCGGQDRGWEFSPDPGIRVQNAVSAEAMRQPDGSILLWANTLEGIAAFRSRDGLTFRPAAGRMPLGAHPTVVKLPTGRLRMYYSTPANLPFEPSRVRSATSRDGLTWFLEDGNRFPDAGFGVMEVVPLEDGTWRLYLNDRPFKGKSSIVSGRSTKGLTFHPERGVRLPHPYADPAVVRLESGRWLMVLSAIEQRQRLYVAESADGLEWKLEEKPLLEDDEWSLFDPTLLPLGGDRYRVYYTRSRGSVFELHSGVLNRG
ncbi:MAG TPA: exo-alpha-sialidase [Gaiellaceae bacterium]|nr:exo-alpha-sialidase [Gaiellaceae bacterium]